jgi:hypothetical protein
VNDITENDLLRLVEGEIDGADELRRIEAALDSEPELARQLDELEAALAPDPEVQAGLRRQFDLLNSSIWGRIEFPVWIGTRPKTATLHLPNGSAVPVRINASEESVSLHLDNPIPGWRAASIVLFHPQGPIGETLERVWVEQPPDRCKETVTPARRATGASRSPAAEQEHHAALQDKVPVWRSEEAVGMGDGRAWLEESLDEPDRLLLCVNLPEQTQPAEHIRYRLDWRDPQGHQQDERGFATLLANSGRRVTNAPLKTPAEAIKTATYWKLWVQVILAPRRPELDSSDFQDRSGENTEVLILHPAAPLPGRGTSEFQARFYSDAQRQRWNDDTADCWVRFETDDWQPEERR